MLCSCWCFLFPLSFSFDYSISGSCLECSSLWTVLAIDVQVKDRVNQHYANLSVKVHPELCDVFLVNLEFMGLDQLSPTHAPIRKLFEKTVTQCVNRKRGSLTGNMFFEPYESCGKHGTLPFDKDFAEAFLGTIDDFLTSCGAKPDLESTHRASVKLKTGEGVTCGALSTLYACLQHPHTDIHGKELDDLKVGDPVPYQMDLPLTDDGCQLAMYGSCFRTRVTPVIVSVPHGWCLLRRLVLDLFI